MSTFDVAHIREQGQDIIMVLVDRAPTAAQTAGLQSAAAQAGLRGAVVPVWDEFGRPKFHGPPHWGSYFRSLTWDYVRARINRQLMIG